MILSADDVASLSKSLSRWEYAEYICAGLVAVACAGEYAADFTDWFTGGDEQKKKRLAKLSTLLLIAALAFELVCLVTTNSVSGLLIGSLSDKAERAEKDAQQAIRDSGIAEKQSSQATTDAGAAITDSGAAKRASSNALTLARGARQEADSFEQDIKSAKKTATEAESHLADALRRANAAQAALDKIKTPRTLTPEQQGNVADKLKVFSVVEFDVGITQGSEPEEFSSNIEDALEKAGWTEVDWKGGDIVFTRVLPRRTAGIVTLTGVVIQMHPEQVAKFNFWGAAKALAEALKAEGIEAQAEPGVGPKNDNHNAIHVLVGEKPKS